MAQAVIGALRVSLGLDSAQFTSGLSAAQKTLQDTGKRLQSIGTNMASIGTGMTAAITAPLVGLGAMAVAEASEMRDALGQVNAALTSMGGVGGRTLEQLKAQADALAGASLFEDDQILRGVTANLLTFGNIAGTAFDRAQQAAVDLSARLGQDLQASTIMIGKALNAPTQGLAALRRVGIQFTADQEAMIKSMDASGNAAGAQAIMLSELERQFGGSAKAAMDAANPMERMRLSFAAMAGDIGAILLPFVDKVAAAFSGLAARFGQMSPQMQQFTVIAGVVAAALGPLLIAVGAIVASIGVLLPIVGAITAPFLAAAAVVAALGVAFYVFRDDIIPIVQQFAKQVQENVGPKIMPLWEALKGAVSAVGEVFSAIFGEDSPGGASQALKVWGEIVSRIWGAAIDIITAAINVITNILRALGALLRGDFSAMWGYLGSAVMSVVRGIGNAFQTLFPEVVSWVRQTFEGVKTWLLDRFAALVRGIGEKVTMVTNFFRDMYIAVVGNSYVPDMVREIGDWMGNRLRTAMVDPAASAIGETTDAFGTMAGDVGSQMERLFQSISSKDWKGALGGVFEMLGGMGGKLGSFGNLGSSILKNLPGFSTGGSFRVGGSGPADSKVMGMRLSPGEMVDIRKPGQSSGAGRPISFDMRGAVVTADLLRQMEAMATKTGGAAFGAARAAVPADMAQTSRYTRR